MSGTLSKDKSHECALNNAGFPEIFPKNKYNLQNESKKSSCTENKLQDSKLSKSQRKRRKKKNASDNMSSTSVNFNTVQFSPHHLVNASEIEKIIYNILCQLCEKIDTDGAAKRVGSSLPTWDCPPYRHQLKGIVNHQNNCYLLSCLQALFSLSPLVALLDKLSEALHTAFCEVGSLNALWTPSLAVTTPILRLLVLLLDEMSPYVPNKKEQHQPPTQFGLLTTGAPLKLTSSFVHTLCFDEGYEQDAADCMSRIITQLHEEMASIVRRFKPAESFPTTVFDDFVDEVKDEDDDWMTIGTQGKKFAKAREVQVDNGEVTPISLLFGGTLVSRCSYNKTSSKSNKLDISTKERFFVLPLELKNPQVKRIEDCFVHLSQGETLSDFRDPDNGSCVVMARRVFIDHLPPVLLLQLNRFYYASEKNMSGNVEFGIHKVLKQIPVYKQLKISCDAISKERQYTQAQGTYQLHAIIFHVGYRATRGHYTTSVLDPTGQKEAPLGIIYFDDERVFNLKCASSLADLLGTHKPFDLRSGRFQVLRPECDGGDTPPSIAEQPRTPYLLVYTSCFH